MSEYKDFSNKKVLVVDDVPLNVLLAKKMLSKLGVSLASAVNGQDALDKVAADKPDLMLLDIMMPVMDGFETLQHLRANEATKDVRVIVLSALNNEPEIMKAMNLGANDFVTKPIIMERLINAVIKQLS